MSHLLRRLTQTISIPSSLFIRPICSTAPRRNSTPDWESLIGGHKGTEKRRLKYEAKYLDLLKRKAEEKGLSIEELKAQTVKTASSAKRVERTGETSGPVPAGSQVGNEVDGKVVRPLPSAENKAKTTSPIPKSDSPVKPLNDIMDLSKATSLSSTSISNLWTTYHQTKGYLSAAIPVETYLKMIKLAKKYPIFVLPLNRDVSVGEREEDKAKATEMYLMEWALLPPPSTSHTSLPSPSTVLFTPLAEYKARQAYAQPYLILTHYSDLADSHGLILMRGELTTNVALEMLQAQLLVIRMQLFYNNQFEGRDEEGSEMDRERVRFLKGFHERPEEFDWKRLIDIAEITEPGKK